MKRKPEPSLFILLLLVSFASVSAVLFTPALPQIKHDLDLTAPQAELMVTLFLVGYALGTLPYGPLSNRFGRKPAIYAGVGLAIIGSLIIVVGASLKIFGLILIGRILTALGSSVGLKIVFTIIGDVYKHEEATRKIAYTLLSFAIAPGLAVAIGGFLTEHMGWVSCFYFLIVYSLFVFIMAFFLPETSRMLDPKALDIAEIKAGYLTKLKNKKLVACALMMGCGTSIVYLFASEAPFIGIIRIKLSESTYGLLNFIPPIGLIAGSFLSNYFVGKREPLYTISLGVLICLIASGLMLLLFLGGVVNAFTLFAFMPLIYVGISLVTSNVLSLAMSHSTNKSNASAMLNFINMSTAVSALLLMGALHANSASLLPIFFTALGVLLVLLYKHLKKIELARE